MVTRLTPPVGLTIAAGALAMASLGGWIFYNTNVQNEYRTQLEVMSGFLRSFVTRNELFSTVDGRVLERIASIH